jgi:hypothetical protein
MTPADALFFVWLMLVAAWAIVNLTYRFAHEQLIHTLRQGNEMERVIAILGFIPYSIASGPTGHALHMTSLRPVLEADLTALLKRKTGGC